ncbi:DUF4157 domain-containing protein [Streptomyces sp. NPDC101490]|uniref:eCIS core domain-containing protein n=1 Tax=Streptomyces sp. NPDC101490 TaxID=3366143 RepID=UPI0038050069
MALKANRSQDSDHQQTAARVPLPTSEALNLQRTAGNSALVQLLRQAGHPWAQEQHQHTAGCGHQQSTRAEQPAVQRSAVHDVLAGTGRPLGAPLREEMEARLGADFADVRIHDNQAARASATEIGARAYTSGNNIVLGDGGSDNHTLAHELTHVIQQRQGPVTGIDQGNGLKVSDPSDRYEQEAESNAHRVMNNPAPVQRDTSSTRPNTRDYVTTDETPAIQRKITLDHPKDPQNSRSLDSVTAVQTFLSSHGISIVERVAASEGTTLTLSRGAEIGYKANAVMHDMVENATALTYSDDKEGAEALAKDICDKFAKLPHRSDWNSGAPSQQEGSRMGIADRILGAVGDKIEEKTGDLSFGEGFKSGVKKAFKDRSDALQGNMKVPTKGELETLAENLPDGGKLTLYALINGQDDLQKLVTKAASYGSQEGGAKFNQQANEGMDRVTQNAGGTIAGSILTSGAFGVLATVINPAFGTAVRIGSGAVGAAAVVNEGVHAAQKLEEIRKTHPAAYNRAMMEVDQSLNQTYDNAARTLNDSAQNHSEGMPEHFSNTFSNF